MIEPLTMTWDEAFRAIRGGDRGVIIALGIECLIMASPLFLIGAAFWFGN